MPTCCAIWMKISLMHSTAGQETIFFGSLEASRPEIYPIYWSQAQMQARQRPEMHQVQSFLNRLWTYESEGQRWFDPDVNILYPDRIRRRLPGTTSKGLGAHTDSGALERWLLPAYQRVFHAVFNGDIDRYDPGMPLTAATSMNTMYRTPQNVLSSALSRAGPRCPI